MQNNKLNHVLKTVSRSFYLSIRILPSAMREPVSIAYLLARAADSIADTAMLDHNKRLEYLLNFKHLLVDSNLKQKQLQDLQSVVSNIEHAGERELLSQLSNVLMAYQQLSPKDHEAVEKVVYTLTTGMEKDLHFFKSEEIIKALPDDDTLDEYTYYVAGCVGEFWTDLSIIHTPSLSHWHQKNMSQLGIEFGKALQLTNILRDIAKDVKLNRCYLPGSDLKKYSFSPDMLFDKQYNRQLTPVILKWLKQADQYFDSAEIYLLNIPRHCFRLRLAALWPIIIGLATLKLIKEKKNYLDADTNVKVKRKWVYKMLLMSIPAVLSNTLLRYWIKSLRNHYPT
ncbi:MAG: squalene/phytoene synthase family protein [Gammaproteobacteria bacterium]|nr:squalene/phytoene synthase family protein [Gammaproteobacteria bacterium]